MNHRYGSCAVIIHIIFAVIAASILSKSNKVLASDGSVATTRTKHHEEVNERCQNCDDLASLNDDGADSLQQHEQTGSFAQDAAMNSFHQRREQQEGGGSSGADGSSGSTGDGTTTASCSICDSSSFMQSPDKPLFFVGDAITCRSADTILSTLSDGECDVAKMAFKQYPFDIAAYCECAGTAIPNTCQMCSRTSEGRLINDENLVDLGNNVTVTCLEAEELVPYISDPSVCEVEYERAAAECCFGVPTSPAAAPTPPPAFSNNASPAPTFAPPVPSSASTTAKHGVGTLDLLPLFVIATCYTLGFTIF